MADKKTINTDAVIGAANALAQEGMVHIAKQAIDCLPEPQRIEQLEKILKFAIQIGDRYCARRTAGNLGRKLTFDEYSQILIVQVRERQFSEAYTTLKTLNEM